MDIIRMTATDLAEAIQTKTITARRAAETYLTRIEKHDKTIGAFVSVNTDAVLKQADAVDKRIDAGESVGALAGVPIAIKDNLCVAGERTTCASRMLADYHPPYSAHVVEKLRAADAVLIGKTNLDEFAMGSSTENSAIQCTRNPRDPSRIPGGSSGGSAAAVAAGFAPLALGSDTGGSIRQPASHCGCVGMKPTYGMVSRWGLVAFGSSLDQIGPFTRTVGDTALLLSAIAGPDPRDATCRQTPPADFRSAINNNMDGIRIGIPKEYFDSDGLDTTVRERVETAIETLRSAGATTHEISLPMMEYAVPTYYIIATAEASSNLARYDGAHYGHRTTKADNIIDLFSRSREEGFGAEVKRRIMLGTYVLSAGYYDAYYLRALRVRQRIANDFENAFKQVDVIAAPVSPCTAFGIGERMNDPLAMYLSDIYTISANLAAIPGISVPCGTDNAGLPIGLQLMAGRFQDATLLRTAAAYENAANSALGVAELQ